MHKIWHMKSLTFETKSLHSENSHVGHLNLIHESRQIRHEGFNWFKGQFFLCS